MVVAAVVAAAMSPCPQLETSQMGSWTLRSRLQPLLPRVQLSERMGCVDCDCSTCGSVHVAWCAARDGVCPRYCHGLRDRPIATLSSCSTLQRCMTSPSSFTDCTCLWHRRD